MRSTPILRCFTVFTIDVQSMLHNLHEEVSCSVCMTKFTDPKQLPCLHSFCLHCLQGIQQTSGIRETISCPECRHNFRIPGDGDQQQKQELQQQIYLYPNLKKMRLQNEDR